MFMKQKNTPGMLLVDEETGRLVGMKSSQVEVLGELSILI